MSAEDSTEAPREETETGTPEAGAASEDDASKPKELTPEEQMALYEESLKDDDWGHQPC